MPDICLLLKLDAESMYTNIDQTNGEAGGQGRNGKLSYI